MKSLYKAAGKSAAALITQKSAAKDVEYEKEYELGRYAKQMSLIGLTGSSIANILGIIDERKRLSRFEGYRQEAAGLPGVSAIEKEYQPLGGFGKLIGLGPRTRTDYISAHTGRALPDEMMTAIGFMEQHGISTKYSDVGAIGEAMRERVPAETYKQAGVSSQEEYEKEMGMGEFSLEEVPIGSQTAAEEAIDSSIFGGPEIPMDWELEGGGQWVDEWLKDNPSHPKTKEWLNKQAKKTAATVVPKIPEKDVEDTIIESMKTGDKDMFGEPTIKDYFGLEGGKKQLAVIIAKQEGFYKKGSLPKKLNNPGALMDPDTGKLREFKSMKEGFDALIDQLDLYASGKSKSGITSDYTISQFVDRYVAGGDISQYEKRYPGELSSYKKAITMGTL